MSRLSDLQVRRVMTGEQLDAAWRVRLAVFVEEQHVSLEEEIDDADTAPTTTHVIVVPSGQDAAVATGRLLIDPAHPGVVHIGRVAVLQEWRTSGVGGLVMRALEDIALSEASVDGRVRIELSAQEQAFGFYERLGYTITGERYLDAKIWHRDAHKTVVDTSASSAGD